MCILVLCSFRVTEIGRVGSTCLWFKFEYAISSLLVFQKFVVVDCCCRSLVLTGRSGILVLF